MSIMKSIHSAKLISTLTVFGFTPILATASTSVSTIDIKPTKNNSSFNGSLSFQTNELMEEVGDVVGNKYFGALKFRYDTEDKSTVRKVFDVSSKINDQEQLMYSLKEASLEFKGATSSIRLGRSLLNWSEADRTWGLGKVNNRENFDYFEPGQEGLTGIFYDKKFANNLRLGAFGSLLYIPEMNPGMKINKEEGTVECQNPWCNAPSSSAEIGGSDVPIYYNVNYPEISEVVFRYSVGLNLAYDYKKLSVSGYYLRKPENSVSVTAEVHYDTTVDEIFVDVTPQFYYHDIKGAEATYKLGSGMKLYGSSISIVPNNFPDGDEPLLKYTGIKPKKKNEDYIGGGFKYNRYGHRAHLGYLARVSEFDRENEILVEYPRWNQALLLQYNTSLTRKLSLGLDVKYDMITEDRLTMVKANYVFGKNLVAGFGFNMIGTSPAQDSYWSKYENNDSVYSSLKYNF